MKIDISTLFRLFFILVAAVQPVLKRRLPLATRQKLIATLEKKRKSRVIVPIHRQETILHAVGFTPVAPFPTQATKPFGLPQIWSLAFWGGVWGLVWARVNRWFPRGAGYWAAACIFGAVFPSLVAWLVVFPLKGLPAGGGWHAAGLATGLMINGGWGWGTALLLQGLSKGWRSGSLGIRPQE